MRGSWWLVDDLVPDETFGIFNNAGSSKVKLLTANIICYSSYNIDEEQAYSAKGRSYILPRTVRGDAMTHSCTDFECRWHIMGETCLDVCPLIIFGPFC